MSKSFKGYSIKRHVNVHGQYFGWAVFTSVGVYTGLWGLTLKTVKRSINEWESKGGRSAYLDWWRAAGRFTKLHPTPRTRWLANLGERFAPFLATCINGPLSH